MSTSGNKRPLRQSKSLPLKRGCNVDELLSVGFDKSRASAFFSQTCLPSKDESSDYKKLYEDLQEENKDLHKKHKKEIEDLHKKYKKEIEDLQSGRAILKLRAELQEILGEIKILHHREPNVGLMRKALHMDSNGNGGWNTGEALSAGFDQSRASALFFQTCPPLKDEFSDLKKMYEGQQKEIEDLQKENKDLHKKCKGQQKEIENLQKGYKDVHKKYKDVQSAEANVKSKAELRQLLRNFIDLQESLRRSGRIGQHEEVNVVLMQKAREKYPNDFPLDFFPQTFKGTVAALVNEKANKSTKYKKLDLLRDVAKAFKSKSLPWWNAKMGEQFFILCKSVAQWNNEDFHPKLIDQERRECQSKADKGIYSVDDVNLGQLVKELLHPTTLHSFVD